MSKKFARLVIGLMQALQIPISVYPFWYRQVRSGRNHYRPFFEPWLEDERFRSIWPRVQEASTSLDDTAYLLFSFARMAAVRQGEIWECGVYKGATAKLLAAACDPKQTIRLFDTFSGMPEQRPEMDSHKIGSLGDTSVESVKALLAGHDNIDYRAGFIPRTFEGLENSVIAFAHIDVDQYETSKECCRFIFPRLVPGGIVVVDDYGRPGTPGSKLAVDEYLATINLKPAVLSTGQAVIIR